MLLGFRAVGPHEWRATVTEPEGEDIGEEDSEDEEEGGDPFGGEEAVLQSDPELSVLDPKDIAALTAKVSFSLQTIHLSAFVGLTFTVSNANSHSIGGQEI